MDKKKIAYLQFPGSNTENETKNILQKAWDDTIWSLLERCARTSK